MIFLEKILLIYNPNSGKKTITTHLDKIIEIFSSADKLVTLYRIGDMNYTIEEVISSNEFDGVVVCGGDGSVNTVVKILLDTGKDIPIGVIPCGTCNDFSRSLGMPNDIVLCARLIAQGKTAKIDIGFINNESVFVNELAGGVIVTASFSTDQNLKKMFGPLAYYVTGIGELANIKPFDITVETEEQTYNEQALVFLVLNGTDISGFSNVIKEAQMQDGKMNILIFKDAKPLEITDTLLRFVSGTEFKEKSVTRIQTHKCKITCPDNINTTVDGERGPSFPITLEMKKQAIQIYC